MTCSSKSLVFTLILLTSVTVILCGESEECGAMYTKEDVETEPGIFVTKQRYIQPYTCPVVDYPSATKCCTTPRYKCCREKYFWEIGFWLGIAIAAAVVFVCLVLCIGFIWCCCSEKCPLYMVCRKEAKMDYIADNNDPATQLCPMPGENDKNCKIYVPSKAIMNLA